MPMGFQVVASWDWSTNLPLIQFLNIGALSDVLFVSDGLVLTGNPVRVQVSVDNTNWLGTNGDYKWMFTSDGGLADRSAMLLNNSAAGTQTHMLYFPIFGLAG